jgi:hypothetical protein
MSGVYVPYHQRQNKAVDRQLFIDILQRVNRKISIQKALYVGFGGAYLEDFKLIHAVFGSKRMISLEMDESAWKRQKFNRPLSCINCLNMTSGDFINDLRGRTDGANNLVIWLDYASANGIGEQIQEFRTILPKLARYDVLKITINANPNTLHENQFDSDGKKLAQEELLKLRAEELKSRSRIHRSRCR